MAACSGSRTKVRTEVCKKVSSYTPCSRPHGDGLLVMGLFFTDYPPSWEKIPPVEDPGLCDPLGEPGWLSW